MSGNFIHTHTHTSKQSQDEHYLDPKKKTSKFKEKMMSPVVITKIFLNQCHYDIKSSYLNEDQDHNFI